MKDTDIAWIAGIIEGEGCISIRKRARGRDYDPAKGYRYEFSVHVSMTDRDVIEALQEKSGFGSVREVKTPALIKRGNKTLYRWSVTKRSELEELCKLILPYLFERRSAKVNEALSLMREFRCSQGQRTDLILKARQIQEES